MSDAESDVAGEIVAAACTYFLRFGYSQVSTEEIARSVGRSKKTIYKHFPSKEALLAAVLAHGEATLQQEIAVIQAEAGGQPPLCLRRILAVVTRRLVSTHQVLLADLRACDPDLAASTRRTCHQSLRRLLTPVLSQAVAAGVIQSGFAPDRFLDMLLAGIEGLAAQDAHADGRCDDLAALLMDGLAVRPRAGTPAG